MRDEITGTSVWCTLFAGVTILGAGAAATAGAAPVAIAAGGAILGNIAAAKLQRLVEAFNEHRNSTGAFGGGIDRNHDEARAIRVAQVSALRGLARASQPMWALFGNNRRRNLCQTLDDWAGKALKVSDEAIEQALRTAAPVTLARMTGAQRGPDAGGRDLDLQGQAEQAVWQEVMQALSIWDDTTEDAAWLKAAFLDRDTGWFALFARQWHAALKSNPRVNAIVLHMQQALMIEKIDAVKEDTTAIRSGVEALPDEIRAIIGRELDQRGVIAQARDLGLTAHQVEGILAAFGKSGLPPEEWAKGLMDSARQLQELQTRFSALSNEEPEIAALVQAAGAAIEAGDFARADTLLAEAEQRDVEAGVARIRRAAETRFKRGELARGLQDHWTAGEHFEAAARLISVHDPVYAAECHFWAGYAFDDHGQLFPGPGLDRAAAAFRAALEVYTQDAKPTDWAITQNNLGSTLRVQGQRTGGAAGLALLADSVAACRAAQEVFTQDTLPAQRAANQINLGNTLRVQGERTGGDAGLALLADSVAAYRAALAVYTQDAMPADWAGTQNNLGLTLWVQGQRTGGDAGLALLADSVAACRAALTVRTQAAMPADWAATQNNLGNTLSVQGERTGGAAGLALLADSVAAYRAALEVYTRDAMPANWAMTQNNLGNTLQTQGERTGGDAGLALLAESVAAYRAALTVHTQAAMPAQWAMTQTNLALAELSRFTLSSDPAHLAAARVAAEAAMSVFGGGGMEYDVETCQRLLDRIAAAGG